MQRHSVVFFRDGTLFFRVFLRKLLGLFFFRQAKSGKKKLSYLKCFLEVGRYNLLPEKKTWKITRLEFRLSFFPTLREKNFKFVLGGVGRYFYDPGKFKTVCLW